MGLKVFKGAGGSKFVCDDTSGFGDAVAAISLRAAAPIVSCAREPAAEPLLRRIGKKSQRQLFACAQARLNTGVCPPDCGRDCNAANPPGRSTHERRNDGVAYRAWPPLFRLPYWARGIDVRRDRVGAFCAEARKAGWTVTATYPGSPSESQHVNFRKRPRISLWEVRPLAHGSRGRRASEVIRLLRDGEVLDPDTREPYLDPAHKTGGRIDATTAAAIRRFQQDHHQKPDGHVGVHTIRALRAAHAAPPQIVSDRGIRFIKGFEGLRLFVYADSAGHATVGWGHKLHDGPPTARDEERYGTQDHPRMTRTQADRLFLEDLERVAEAPLRRLPRRLKRQREFDGIASAVFNLGPGVLNAGRSLGDALRAGSAARAADALLLYVRAGEVVLPGLQRRRRAERQIVLRGKYES